MLELWISISDIWHGEKIAMLQIQREEGKIKRAFHLVLKTTRRNSKHKNQNKWNVIWARSSGFPCYTELGNLLLALGSSPNKSFKNLWLPETSQPSQTFYEGSKRADRKPSPSCQTCLLWRTLWSTLRFYLSKLMMEHREHERGYWASRDTAVSRASLISEPFVWILSYWVLANYQCVTAQDIFVIIHCKPCCVGAIISSLTQANIQKALFISMVPYSHHLMCACLLCDTELSSIEYLMQFCVVT